MTNEKELHEETAVPPVPREAETGVIEIRVLDRIETIGTKSVNN
ncbi:hypothetical protein AB0L33_04960 [Streptomyces sp. NPDC052299]